MADPVAYQQESTASTSGTETVTVVEVGTTDGQPTETLQLKLRKPRNDKKVQWSTETVDNEHMNKKNSKSCCIYKKPREFGESSSDEDSDDDHDDHCVKHVEKKKAMEKQAETTENSTVMENDQTVETTIDNQMESVEEMRKEEAMDENKTEPPDDEQV